jgi:hypothetical protein
VLVARATEPAAKPLDLLNLEWFVFDRASQPAAP